MRRVVTVVVALFVLAVAAVAADVTVPFARIVPGSYSALRANELESLPPESSCAAPVSEACPARYVFSPNKKLTVWFSVRNESPVAVTLDGVPDAWFAQFAPNLLVRPVAQLDGGDPYRGTGNLSGPAFRPVALGPHAERLVGLDLVTTSDVTYACGHWIAGSGIGWSAVPVSWHWALARHEETIAFARPILVMAPTSRDCGT